MKSPWKDLWRLSENDVQELRLARGERKADDLVRYDSAYWYCSTSTTSTTSATTNQNATACGKASFQNRRILHESQRLLGRCGHCLRTGDPALEVWTQPLAQTATLESAPWGSRWRKHIRESSKNRVDENLTINELGRLFDSLQGFW